MFDLPIVYALTAGFAALASPCGAAMLPAYIGYYLGIDGSRDEGPAVGNTQSDAWRAPARALQNLLLVVGTVAFFYFVLGLLFNAEVLHLMGWKGSVSVGFSSLAITAGIELLLSYRDRQLAERWRVLVPRFVQALVIGGTASLAFIMLFGAFGLVWGALGTFLRDIMPYIAIFLGVALALFGAYMVAFMLVNKRAMSLIPTIGVNWGTGNRGLLSIFLFGLAYALATLSCTFPIFLAITVNALTSSGPAAVVLQFTAYGAGMGIGLIGLTLVAAFYHDMARMVLRKAIPIVEWGSPAFLILAGAYITYYWWVNWFAFNADL